MKRKSSKLVINVNRIISLSKDFPIRVLHNRQVFDYISRRTNVKSKDVRAIVHCMYDILRREILLGNKVKINDFLQSFDIYGYPKFCGNKLTISLRARCNTPKVFNG